MARTAIGPIDRVLVVEHPHPLLDERLRAAGVEVVRHPGPAPSEDELVELLRRTGARALFKRSRTPVTRRVFEAVPHLFAVQLCSIGVDSVDLDAAAEHGVLVFNDPVSNGRSVAELVVGQLVALSRRLYEADRSCRAGLWDKTAEGRHELRGHVLGVVGLGRIGRQVARLAEGLGMHVRYWETEPVARDVGRDLGWEPADSLADLFRGADAVTLHVSAEDHRGRSNRGLVGRELLEQLGADRPPGSLRLFLNLARGFLHDPADLLAALRSGAVRYAAVDVYPDEPRGRQPWRNPYADEPRVALTPHIGASTEEAQPRIAERVAATFLDFSLRGAIRDCALAPRLELSLPRAAPAVLVVVHTTERGTKAAVDEVIYEAGASNLASVHEDLPERGIAVEVAGLDRPLSAADLERLAARAAERAGRPDAVRSARVVVAPAR